MSRRAGGPDVDVHASDEEVSDDGSFDTNATNRRAMANLQQSNDDDEEFGIENYGGNNQQSKGPSKNIKTQQQLGLASKRVADAPYDEAVDVADDSNEEINSPAESPRDQRAGAKSGASRPSAPQKSNNNATNSASESESEEEHSGKDGQGAQKSTAKLYNAADYAQLQVSSEIQDIFDYIGRYSALDIALDTKMKPFIPDYIPAIGEIDSFIKIPHPDEKIRDDLGLVVLDEPATNQSDPTVLELQLRVISKQATVAPVTVRSIDSADKNPKKIAKWVQSIEEIHRQKPPPAVDFSVPPPDIDSLMQAWPAEFERALGEIELPNGTEDLRCEEFARVACAILDIPVHGKLTESLHTLFSLYLEFRNNPHFQS
jgi:intraflagellar transport protein 46